MFTAIACGAIVVLALYGAHANSKERERVSQFDDDLVRQSIVFIREDAKLIALVLAGILVMLGVIADKLK